MSDPSASRLARALGRASLGEELAERLLDDLADEVERHRRSRVWFWRQLLLSILILRRQRRRAAPAGPGAILQGAAHDLRHGVRGLRRAPLFTVAAVTVLALGIGATTAVYTVIDTVLLRPLPYEQPERLVRLWAHLDDGTLPDFSFRVLELRAFEQLGSPLEVVGAEFAVSTILQTGDGEPRRVQGRRVSADYFRVFGVEPRLGRSFTAEEILASDQYLAMISDRLWRQELGAEPLTASSTIELDGRGFRVIGVLPEEFRHVSGEAVDVYIPYSLGTASWTGRWLDVYVRAASGASFEQIDDRIEAAMVSVARADGREPTWNATVQGLHEMVVGTTKRALWATLGVVTLVLLIACLNVATLCLVRATTRADEIAVRSALGASRWRVIRHLMAENLLLGLLGAGAGIALAGIALRLVVALAPTGIPRITTAELDMRVLGFALALTLGTVLLFGSSPAWVAARTRSRGAAGPPGSRLRSAMAVLEVAVAVVLLVGAGVMVQSLLQLRGTDLGFDRESAVTFRLVPPRARYEGSAEVTEFYRSLRARLLGLADVVAVGAGSDLPLSGEGAVASVNSEDRVRAGVVDSVTALQRRATEGYFEALRVPLIEGRGFDGTDRRDGQAVAILSESLAHALFPRGGAVGKRVGWGADPDDEDWMRVVGVVADVRFEAVDKAPRPQIYQAHAQSTPRDMAVVVRGVGLSSDGLSRFADLVRQADREVAIYDLRSLGSLVDDAVARERFAAILFGLFASLALTLTVAGIYGVLAYVVHERRREVAVRIATGADPRSLVLLMTRRGVRLVAFGVALGAPAAWLAARAAGALLYGVGPGDPGAWGGAVALLLSTAGLAAYLPARRAGRLDPMQVLRDE